MFGTGQATLLSSLHRAGQHSHCECMWIACRRRDVEVVRPIWDLLSARCPRLSARHCERYSKEQQSWRIRPTEARSPQGTAGGAQLALRRTAFRWSRTMIIVTVDSVWRSDTGYQNLTEACWQDLTLRKWVKWVRYDMTVDVKVQSAKCRQASSQDKDPGHDRHRGLGQATPRHRKLHLEGSVHGNKGLHMLLAALAMVHVSCACSRHLLLIAFSETEQLLFCFVAYQYWPAQRHLFRED